MGELWRLFGNNLTRKINGEFVWQKSRMTGVQHWLCGAYQS